MKERISKVAVNKKYLILCILIFAELLYWFVAILDRAGLLQTYFVNDPTNTFMDYFNMLELENYKDPYILNSNYPPLVFLVLKVLYRIVPKQFRYHNAFELRNLEFAYLGLILMTVVCFLLIVFSIQKLVNDKVEQRLMIIAIFLSGPILFCIERGNIIFLSFSCLLYYIAYWNDEKKSKRYIAYFMLAISAGLKLYPALFGLLPVTKKRWKEAVVLLFMGVAVYVVPAFFFDGFATIKASIKGLFVASSAQSNLGMNYNFSAKNFTKILLALGGKIVSSVPTVCVAIAAVGAGTLFAISKDLWKKTFAICLLCIWIPEFSYTYIMILITIPFILYMKEMQKNKLNVVYSILFILLLIPIYLPLTKLDYPGAKFYLAWPTVLANMSLVMLFVVALIEDIARISKKHVNKNQNEVQCNE